MFQIFSQMWVLGFLLHHSENWKPVSLTVIGLGFLIWILSSREKWRPFVASLIFSVGVGLYETPFLANHFNFYLVVSLALLIWLFLLFFSHRDLFFPLMSGGDPGLSQQRQDLLEKEFLGLRPVICLSLFVVYFMAGFHKLNTDFLNPDSSCAVAFLYRYSGDYGLNHELIPEFLIDMTPVKVLVVEILGAFLLLVPRLRILGILCFVSLHSYLAPLSFYDFASICYAILICFLPAKAFASEGQRLRWQRGVTLLSVTMMVSAMVALVMVEQAFTPIEPNSLQGLPFVAASFYLLYQGFVNMREAGLSFWTSQTVVLWGFQKKAFYLLPLFLLFYTNMNYLGLRTAGNTTMFSNLTTEGGQSNHLLMPVWLQIFDFQKNLIFVESLPADFEDWERTGPAEGTFMTEFEWRRFVHAWRKAGEKVPATISQNGVKESYEDVTRSSWARDTPSWFLRKTMLFREIQEDREPNYCRW